MENSTRSTTVQICQHCGKEFETQRRDAKYCSNACRQQAYLVRSAPAWVEKQLQYIEEEIRRMERVPSYLTRQNIEQTFEELRTLAWPWHYDKLPSKHRLRNYVEDTLAKRIEALRKKINNP